jgi:hypothetical protein
MIAVTPAFLDVDENQILFWNFQSLDASRAPQEQPDGLKEDLGQLVLGPGVLLDIGWYPRLDATGSFVVQAVREGEWETPIARQTATDWAGLVSAVARVRALARVDVLDRQR